MRKFFNTLMAEESGQGMAEYALIISLVAIALIAFVRQFGDRLVAVFNGMTFTTS